MEATLSTKNHCVVCGAKAERGKRFCSKRCGLKEVDRLHMEANRLTKELGLE